MSRENKVPSLIISILSLIVLGFILFMSVYNQIMSQSDGFFNMIIFAGILLLVFILISLIVKLMAFTPSNDYSPVLKYLFFFFAVGLVILNVFMRIRYTSSVFASDFPFYKACEYIYDGTLPEAIDVFPDMLYGPSQFAFAKFSSILFSILGLDDTLVVYMNLALLSICAMFAYLCVRTISDQICGFIAFVAVLFIPGNSFAVYSYSPELFYCALFLINVYLYILLINWKSENQILQLIVSVLAGIFSGILVFCDPVSIICILILILWSALKKNLNVLSLVFIPVFLIFTFIGLSFSKSMALGYSITEVLATFPKYFNPFVNYVSDNNYTVSEVFKLFSNYVDDLNYHIVNNYYFLSGNNGETYSAIQAVWLQLGNQLIYMFLIIMSVACILYLIRAKVDKVTPLFSILVASFVMQLLEAKNSSNSLYFGMIFVIIASTTIQHMFLNHHPDIADKLLEIDENSSDEENLDETEDNILTIEDVNRERAIVYYGENDELFEIIKQERKAAKSSESIATTMIKTGFLDGKYVSKEEEIEYFDEIDVPEEHVIIPEVKAIPGTRPVETVKPIAAEDFASLHEFENPIEEIDINSTSGVDDSKADNFTEEDYYFDDEDPKPKDSIDVITSANNDISSNDSNESANETEDSGEFVFRKREKTTDDSANKSEKTVKNKKVKQEKPEKAKKSKKNNKAEIAEETNKQDKPIAKGEKAKKGEKLHNPLPLPKEHVAKDMDFDFDVSDEDDFDY